MDWIQSELGGGASIRAVERLDGSTSAELYKLAVSGRPDGQEYVLRLYTKTDWLAEEPDVPLHEAANLEKLRGSGVIAPRLVALDPAGLACGLPALLMTCLPGKIELTPRDRDGWLRQMAGVLPLLHAIPLGGHRWRYRPYLDVARLQVPGWSAYPELWARAIERVNGPWPAFQPRFIHRDFHPVNVLFQDGRLTGVVDWANACAGPAGIDVAWMRMNLGVMYGLDTADRFLEHCQDLMGSYWQYDPFWDLIVLVEFIVEPPSVYPPWIQFGLTSLTSWVMEERNDQWIARLMG